jgi:hypothetical protein
MKNQIIKKYVPFFNDFLKKIGFQEKNYILFNIEHYKKIEGTQMIEDFIEELFPYYYKNKLNYVTRDTYSYKQFITIMRQIAKNNNIEFTYKIKYIKSKHYIEYYFYIFEDIYSDKNVLDISKSSVDK